MELLYKNDWSKTQERFNAFWEKELVDRPIVQVLARKKGVKQIINWTGWELLHNKDNIEEVVSKFETYCKQTYFGGDEFPNLWINLGAGIMAAYLCSNPIIGEDTVWFETQTDWSILDTLEFNPKNNWWQLTKYLTDTVTELSNNKFFVGITDLGGILDTVAAIRGSQNLLFDLIDNPDKVKRLSSKITGIWIKCYQELYEIINKKMVGSSAWMGLWSPKKWYPIQCDFSAMISPKMFKEFVVPDLIQQCRYLDHSIYHLDGPTALVHLDTLLDITELDGIQWEPGAGNPGTGSQKWIPIYKRIQKSNKLLVLRWIDKEDIDNLINELSPKGLVLHFKPCDKEEEVEELIKRIERWVIEKG